MTVLAATLHSSSARYALYFAPHSDSALWAFGSSVIGYDAASRSDVAFPDHLPFPQEAWRLKTEEPRHYGFHATLKAPFHIRNGYTEQDVAACAAATASSVAAFDLGLLHVRRLGNFVALLPQSSPRALYDLEEACVKGLDRLRAPMSEADRARRLKSALTARQIENLDTWGYPHVFEDFHFHMTLTGRLDSTEVEETAAALARMYAPIAQPLRIAAVALFRQDDRQERFRLIETFDLQAGA